jgi:hypothetical protein
MKLVLTRKNFNNHSSLGMRERNSFLLLDVPCAKTDAVNINFSLVSVSVSDRYKIVKIHPTQYLGVQYAEFFEK